MSRMLPTCQYWCNTGRSGLNLGPLLCEEPLGACELHLKHMFIIRKPRGLICASFLVPNHQEHILAVLKISRGRQVSGFTHLKQVCLHQVYIYSQITCFLLQLLTFPLFTLQLNNLLIPLASIFPSESFFWIFQSLTIFMQTSAYSEFLLAGSCIQSFFNTGFM